MSVRARLAWASHAMGMARPVRLFGPDKKMAATPRNQGGGQMTSGGVVQAGEPVTSAIWPDRQTDWMGRWDPGA